MARLLRSPAGAPRQQREGHCAGAGRGVVRAARQARRAGRRGAQLSDRAGGAGTAAGRGAAAGHGIPHFGCPLGNGRSAEAHGAAAAARARARLLRPDRGTPRQEGQCRLVSRARTLTAGSYVGIAPPSLRNLLQALRDTYCRNIGFEYMFISDRVQRQWIQERIEPVRAHPQLTPDQQKRLLQKLTEAEHLERYLHTKYVGQKRFSLEGGESLIPSVDDLIQRAGANGTQEIVLGMAHRGRLNVLVNVLGKMPKDLFLEFEGKHASELPSGDVKYHNGFSSDISTPGGPVHLSLAFNPSHLEIVNPVVEGSVRARQRRRDDKTGDQVLPILVHGDAAFSGQGVVMETLNLSGTRGYGTGGTVHIIVNNQIGFTTSDPRDTRSTLY